MQEDVTQLQLYDQEQKTQYADQTALYAAVTSVLQPILLAGPNQQGFNAAELNTLNAQAVEGTAENYEGASRAIGESLAGEGGGTNPLPSGAQTQLKAELASSAAASESQQETQIAEANYAQGFNLFQNAEQGLETVAAGENPLGYAQAAIAQEGVTANMESEIYKEQNAWKYAIIGALSQGPGQPGQGGNNPGASDNTSDNTSDSGTQDNSGDSGGDAAENLARWA
jgi:stress response protein SCP2